MQRRWLRHNPFLPGNPPGRGVVMLQRLEAAAAEAGAVAKPHWRALASKGLTGNQAAHTRERLRGWDQASADERAQVYHILVTDGGLEDGALDMLRHAVLLEEWTTRLRETNGAISALEIRIQELREILARAEEYAAKEDGVDPTVREAAQSAAEGADEEIDVLCTRSRELQATLVHDLLVACVDALPALMQSFLGDGLFLPEDVREFRGFSDLPGATTDVAD